MTKLTPPASYRVVVATGTLAVVCYRSDEAFGSIEMAAEDLSTKDVAIGHARFIAQH